jgi:hypothetical protein
MWPPGLAGGAPAGQQQAQHALAQPQLQRLQNLDWRASRATRQQAQAEQQLQRRHAPASRSRFSSSQRSPLLSRRSQCSSSPRLSSRSSRGLRRCRGPAAARGGSAAGSLLPCP